MLCFIFLRNCIFSPNGIVKKQTKLALFLYLCYLISWNANNLKFLRINIVLVTILFFQWMLGKIQKFLKVKLEINFVFINSLRKNGLLLSYHFFIKDLLVSTIYIIIYEMSHAIRTKYTTFSSRLHKHSLGQTTC